MSRARRFITHWLTAALFSTFIIAAPFTHSAAVAAVGDTDSALVLNGTSQYAEVTDPGSSPFDLTGTITIEAWVYSTSTCTGAQVVLVKEVSYMMYCYLNKWLYAFSANGTTWNGDYTSIPVEANAWHHIAYTHSASSANLKVFYDGVNIETLTANMPTSMVPNNGQIRIGQSGGGNFFQGKIDDVRIYNSQRSDAQIQTDMKTWGPNTDSDLIAYYDFNDQSGSTLNNADATPAANTAMTLYGSPTYSNIESTTTVNGDQVIIFPRSYLNSNGGWRIPSYTSSVRSLVIGGGGAGGSRAGGGGGAGGYVYDTSLAVTSNSNISIVVGSGGSGYSGRQGTNGGDSRLGALRTAMGGGGAGGAIGLNNVARAGRSGGSGGGPSPSYVGNGTTATIGTALQNQTYGYGLGNDAGTATINTNWMGGGGGGAGGVGENANTTANYAGKGGLGLIDPIAGTTNCYATGGGGGNSGNYAGAGGTCNGTAVTNNNAGTNSGTVPTAPTTNTGSGGGGSGYSSGSDYLAGANGASGVVILRYPLNMSVTISFSGGTSATYRTVGTITATGTLAGAVTFYERGKAIPGCVRVPMNGSNVATCTWKPSIHGSTTITATAKPSNTYVPNGSTSLNIGVIARSGKR